MIESKAALLTGIRDFIPIQVAIEEQKAMFCLIDPNALYLQETNGGYNILKFGYLFNDSMHLMDVTLYWPKAVFRILSSSLNSFNSTVVIGPDDFRSLKIIEKKDLPLYLERPTEEFEQLLKGE
jgi:hypothetical protein